VLTVVHFTQKNQILISTHVNSADQLCGPWTKVFQINLKYECTVIQKSLLTNSFAGDVSRRSDIFSIQTSKSLHTIYHED